MITHLPPTQFFFHNSPRWLLRMSMAVFFILTLALLSTPVSAAKRIAFVVGIDTYDHLGEDDQLDNPVHDAKAIDFGRAPCFPKGSRPFVLETILELDHSNYNITPLTTIRSIVARNLLDNSFGTQTQCFWKWHLWEYGVLCKTNTVIAVTI